MNIGFVNLDVLLRFIAGSPYGDTAIDFLTVIKTNLGVFIILVLLSGAAQAGLYGCWKKMFGPEKAWSSFIPFYNLFRFFRAIDLPPYLSFCSCLPFVGLIPLGIFNFMLPKAFGDRNLFHRICAVIFPWAFLPLYGFSPKYEFQYVKGKNVPFKDAFRVLLPGEAGYEESTQPNEIGAVGSQISRANALNVENVIKLRNEIIAKEEEAAMSAKAAAEAAKKKAEQAERAKQTTAVSYDIFDNGTIEPSR